VTRKTHAVSALPPPRLLQAANEAIDKLEIRAFIEEKKETLFERLLEAHKNAEAAPVDAAMMFIVLSFPIASSVIHLASNRDALAKARTWAGRIWRKADPVPILSTLTLVHLVQLGSVADGKAAVQDPAWKEIAERVTKLTKEMAEEERLRAEGKSLPSQPT
jgi:hypothetical protein